MEKLISDLIKEKKEEVININDRIVWTELVFSLKYHEVKILELIYLPEPRPTTKIELVRALRRLGYSSKTVQRKIRKFEKIGLIETIRSYGLFINPVIEIEKNVIQLIKQCKIRFGS